MNVTREWKFGTHRAHFEAPDTLVVTFEGPTTLEDAKAAVRLYEEVYRAEGRYFAIADITRSSIDAPARKYIGDEVNPEWFHGLVYVGANLMLRTISKALTVMVLFNAKTTYEVEFAPTVEGGRAVVANWRTKLGTLAGA